MSRQGKPCALHPMPWSQRRPSLLPPCSAVQPGSAVPAAPAFLLLSDPRLPTGVCCLSAWSQCTRPHRPGVPLPKESWGPAQPLASLPASVPRITPKPPIVALVCVRPGLAPCHTSCHRSCPPAVGWSAVLVTQRCVEHLATKEHLLVPPKMLWQCCPQLWDRQGSRLTARTGTPSHGRQDTLPGQNLSRSPCGHAEPQRWGQPRTRTQLAQPGCRGVTVTQELPQAAVLPLCLFNCPRWIFYL